MRTILVAALVSAAVPVVALAQSDADLRNAAKDPGAILTYGMSYSEQRFSPLKQINRGTVKRLVPAWSYSMENNTGEESQALVRNGVIAVNSDTGKIVWQFQTPSGIIGQPVTWSATGKQYVTVTSGVGGVYYERFADPNLVHVPKGGSLWTFKLLEN
jgi:glucose dehydrogenase